MLWNSTGSLGSCAAAAQGRAGGTRPAVTPLCRAWRPPGWDSQGRARAVPPCPKPHLVRLALRDGILYHVIRWNVPFLRYGVAPHLTVVGRHCEANGDPSILL